MSLPNENGTPLNPKVIVQEMVKAEEVSATFQAGKF
jgi:hypothetical protein